MRALALPAVFVLGLAALILSGSAHAKCASRDMSYWPAADQPLAPSGLLYVQGFGGDQAIVEGLKGASLEAGREKIPLVVVARHTGSMRITQVVFRAAKPLKVGATYTLRLDGKTKSWKPTRWLAEGKGPVQWTVAAAPEVAWTGAPRVAESSFHALGCGPSIHQDVTLPLTARAGLVEVTIAGGERTQTYALPVPAEGDLGLGHGMCSGPFAIGGDARFTARFALIDGAGARIPAPGEVQFSGVQPAGR